MSSCSERIAALLCTCIQLAECLSSKKIIWLGVVIYCSYVMSWSVKLFMSTFPSNSPKKWRRSVQAAVPSRRAASVVRFDLWAQEHTNSPTCTTSGSLLFPFSALPFSGWSRHLKGRFCSTLRNESVASDFGLAFCSALVPQAFLQHCVGEHRWGTQFEARSPKESHLVPQNLSIIPKTTARNAAPAGCCKAGRAMWGPSCLPAQRSDPRTVFPQKKIDRFPVVSLLQGQRSSWLLMQLQDLRYHAHVNPALPLDVWCSAKQLV